MNHMWYLCGAANLGCRRLSLAFTEPRPQGRGNECRGQALIEFALTIPVLFLFIALAVNFGIWMNAWISVGDAARAAANYASMGTASVGGPSPPTGGDLANLITADIHPPPNTPSPTISICPSHPIAGVTTWNCASTRILDPEDPLYTSITVDITYNPPLFSFSIPVWGISLVPLPAVHRRTVMRLLQQQGGS